MAHNPKVRLFFRKTTTPITNRRQRGPVPIHREITNPRQRGGLTAETLQNADCFVLTTNHDTFDIEFITKHAKLIVDMRNMVKEANEKVYKL